MSFCRERIAAYKVPRELYLAHALPLNPTDKVSKPALREQVENGSLDAMA